MELYYGILQDFPVYLDTKDNIHSIHTILAVMYYVYGILLGNISG